MNHGMDDDVREAYAEGEPAETGRQHGRAIDEQGVPIAVRIHDGEKPAPGHKAQPGEGGEIGHDLESGRQESMEG
jgi:hypothetical protein